MEAGRFRTRPTRWAIPRSRLTSAFFAAHNYDQRDPFSPPRIRNLTSQRVADRGEHVRRVRRQHGQRARVGACTTFSRAARVNAFHYWYLASGPNNHQTLVDSNGRVALRAYAIANWSRFVRPGWHAVAVRNSGPLLVTAFQNEDRSSSAIVVVNSQPTAVAGQRFEVGRAMQVGHAPLTSSDSTLVAQRPVPLVDGTFASTILRAPS